MSLFSYPEMSPDSYMSSPPFPHVTIRNAWSQPALETCKTDVLAFSDWDGVKAFYGAQSKRYCGTMEKLPDSVQAVIREASTPRFLAWLEHLTGEPSLVPDPYLEGGGIHSIGRGGFLKVHADFNWHKRLHLYRRLNVLIYLNPGWDEAWGGDLQLFTDPKGEPQGSIFPKINTMAIFTTDEASFHGHPHELNCPDGVQRDSIALYYYSAVKPERNYSVSRTTTDYRAMKSDNFSFKVLKERVGAAKAALLGQQ